MTAQKLPQPPIGQRPPPPPAPPPAPSPLKGARFRACQSCAGTGFLMHTEHAGSPCEECKSTGSAKPTVASGNEVKSYATADDVYWRHEKPKRTDQTMLLLTTGEVMTSGQWVGEFGEFFVGWSPMPKIDKGELAAAQNRAKLARLARLLSQQEASAVPDPILEAQIAAVTARPPR